MIQSCVLKVRKVSTWNLIVTVMSIDNGHVTQILEQSNEYILPIGQAIHTDLSISLMICCDLNVNIM